MTASFVMNIGRDTLWTALLVMAPIFVIGFIVGIAVSLIQAVMQIQDSTLSVVPKVMAICVAILIFGHWMLNHLIQYTEKFLGGFPNLISN